LGSRGWEEQDKCSLHANMLIVIKLVSILNVLTTIYIHNFWIRQIKLIA
jgi:hypothetical protein